MITYTSLASGSSGNSHFIKTPKSNILIDIGLTLRYTEKALYHLGADIESINAVFITHDHIDHVSGLGALHRRTGCDIFLTEGTLKKIFPKLGKVNQDKIHIIKSFSGINYFDVEIMPIEVSHDAAEPVCFSLKSSGKKITILTDLGKMENYIIKEALNSDLLVIEANHDKEMLMAGPYPYQLKKRVASEYGHLSNSLCAESVLKIMEKSKPSTVLLAHLSGENNLPELAYKTVENVLVNNGAIPGYDLNLDICLRKQVGNMYRLG